VGPPLGLQPAIYCGLCALVALIFVKLCKSRLGIILARVQNLMPGGCAASGRSYGGWLAIGFMGLCVLGAPGFLALAWRPSIAPIDPPAAGSFLRELIPRGEALAGAGYCATCHTAMGGAPYAGGYGMATPFGAVYSTNITPDRETAAGSADK
jgi:mono/diheme cytochrome c family protein